VVETRRTAVLYGLLFAVPPAIAATTAVDVLLDGRTVYALLAGLTTAVVLFGFVLLVALTGERDAARSQESAE
jgi:hypothetical protein